MTEFSRPLLIACMISACWSRIAPEARAQSSQTHLGRALDQAVLRVNNRNDLRNHRGSGFNRDSFDLHAFQGLGKAEDSTVIGWFTGFSAFVAGIDSTTCGQLTDQDPTGALLAVIPSSMDSIAVEGWVRHWERAVAASFLAPEPPPLNEEELMMAMFALIAKSPDTEISVSTKPSDKPRKSNPQQECRMMQGFFAQALVLEEPTRMTLLRGLAQMMKEKSGLTAVKE